MTKITKELEELLRALDDREQIKLLKFQWGVESNSSRRKVAHFRRSVKKVV